MSIEGLFAEHPDLVDNGVLPTACINKFARDNRGLMIQYEPDDLDLKIYGLRCHATILSAVVARNSRCGRKTALSDKWTLPDSVETGEFPLWMISDITRWL